MDSMALDPQQNKIVLNIFILILEIPVLLFTTSQFRIVLKRPFHY